LEYENWFVRQSAVTALGEIGDPQAVQSLIKTLEDENWAVRQSAAIALGKIGDPQAVQSLIKALSDRNSRVRVSAAQSLVKIGQPAVQPLIKALGDENWAVRQSAANALGKIDDPQAVQALRKRALARKAREVLLVVSKLLVLCSLVFLLVVGLVRVLKYKGYILNGDIKRRFR